MRESDNEAFDSQQPGSRKRQAACLSTVAWWRPRTDVRLSLCLTGGSKSLQAAPRDDSHSFHQLQEQQIGAEANEQWILTMPNTHLGRSH